MVLQTPIQPLITITITNQRLEESQIMIKNKTSKIKPTDSMGQMQSLLAVNGARKIMMDYNKDGKANALSFLMMVNGKPLQFKLTVNVKALLRAMQADKSVTPQHCNDMQAERTAWKNKLEWLQLQLVEIATGQAEIQQLLLGYAITNDGTTIFERITSNNGMKFLSPQSPVTTN